MSNRYPAILLLLLGSLGLVGQAPAQVSRHELGLRLRAFERHLATTTDTDRRSAAYAELDRAVQAFFRLDTKAVVRAIAAADAALDGKPHTPAEAYAHSLQLRLRRRLAEHGKGKIEAVLSAAYGVEMDTPKGLHLQVGPPGSKGGMRLDVTELPMSIALPLDGLPVGDALLTWSLELQDDTEQNKTLTKRYLGLSIANDLEQRLGQLKGKTSTIKKQCRSGDREESIETETLEFLVKMINGTQRRRAAETILPGHRLLAEAEQLAASTAESTTPFYGQKRPGSFWLRVPTKERTITTRFFAPTIQQADAAPVHRPIVIALHGAGGSENLFFDGYGDGLCVRLAAERGWFVVAPRVVLGGVDCAQLVDALANRYRIDKEHVFVVGHSMGAAQAIDNAMRNPSRLHAVAALGGGGRVARTAPIEKLPFLVSAGSRDFALRGARQLHRSLAARGAKAKWREYETVEHFAIVQIALPDVFAFFDQQAR